LACPGAKRYAVQQALLERDGAVDASCQGYARPSKLVCTADVCSQPLLAYFFIVLLEQWIVVTRLADMSK